MLAPTLETNHLKIQLPRFSPALGCHSNLLDPPVVNQPFKSLVGIGFGSLKRQRKDLLPLQKPKPRADSVALNCGKRISPPTLPLRCFDSIVGI